MIARIGLLLRTTILLLLLLREYTLMETKGKDESRLYILVSVYSESVLKIAMN